MLHITKRSDFLFLLSLKGVAECVKCAFYFFGLEVWTDSFYFMEWIMQKIAFFPLQTSSLSWKSSFCLYIYCSFPSGQIKCSYCKPWLQPQPWPFLQVCFSFPSVTFLTPVAGAMAEAGAIFWRCGIGSKLVWNLVVLGVGLRWMDRTRLAGVRVSESESSSSLSRAIRWQDDKGLNGCKTIWRS